LRQLLGPRKTQGEKNPFLGFSHSHSHPAAAAAVRRPIPFAIHFGSILSIFHSHQHFPFSAFSNNSYSRQLNIPTKLYLEGFSLLIYSVAIKGTIN
jgi:hypothetical protein